MLDWFFKKKNKTKNICKVLIIADKPNWAYDSIAKSLLKYNYTDIIFDVDYIKKPKRNLRIIHKEYNLIFFLGWQLLAHIENDEIIEDIKFIDKKKIITGIHSHHSWDNKKTLPDIDVYPQQCLVDYLNKFRGTNCVSKKLYKIFKNSGLKNLTLTENGVDDDIFTQKNINYANKNLTIGFSGNSQNHDWRKGVTEFIIPATIKAKCKFVEANKTSDLLKPLSQMPNFYKKIDLYVCASSSEGFSLSVLEACATGIPVISTRVGGCEDLIIDGYNGFLVERNINSIYEKISYLINNPEKLLEMGKKNREVIESKWSWKIKINSWCEFIQSCLQSDAKIIEKSISN